MTPCSFVIWLELSFTTLIRDKSLFFHTAPLSALSCNTAGIKVIQSWQCLVYQELSAEMMTKYHDKACSLHSEVDAAGALTRAPSAAGTCPPWAALSVAGRLPAASSGGLLSGQRLAGKGQSLQRPASWPNALAWFVLQNFSMASTEGSLQSCPRSHLRSNTHPKKKSLEQGFLSQSLFLGNFT